VKLRALEAIRGINGLWGWIHASSSPLIGRARSFAD
jgi:hypothetical protein